MERSIYRIIDANFNRAREAARLIEEFCRFTLNSALLTRRAKTLRHKLSAAVAEIDAERLLASRDTLGDVGADKPEWNLLKRSDLKDCLTAACKRLPEALRALAEITQTFNPSIAQKFEKLRYTAYTLEKDVFVFSDTTEKFKSVKLYVIITSNLPAEILSLTACCVAGGADCIQLRTKEIQDDKLFALAAEFAKICRDEAVLSIINDRVDIAIASGADGVHLGQNDLPIEQAYKLQLSPLIIGKSTHSLEQLESACREPLTYVGLGPVFTTPTKPSAEAVGLEYVQKATKILTDTGIIGVAVGGINHDNVEQVLKSGVNVIAVCSAVTNTKEPILACRTLKEKILTYSKK